MPSACLAKPKSIRAHDRAILQRHAMANAHAFAHDGMRMRHEIVANLRAAINGNEAVQHRVVADVRHFR